MTKLPAIGVAIGVSFFCVTAAQSMPLAPLEQAPTSLTIPVAGGCGLGFHRGPYGGCRTGRGSTQVPSRLQPVPMLDGLLTDLKTNFDWWPRLTGAILFS